MVFATFSNILNSKFIIWCTLSSFVNPDEFFAGDFVWEFLWDFFMHFKEHFKCVSEGRVKPILDAISLSKLDYDFTFQGYIRIFFSIGAQTSRKAKIIASHPVFPIVQILHLFAFF